MVSSRARAGSLVRLHSALRRWESPPLVLCPPGKCHLDFQGFHLQGPKQGSCVGGFPRDRIGGMGFGFFTATAQVRFQSRRLCGAVSILRICLFIPQSLVCTQGRLQKWLCTEPLKYGRSGVRVLVMARLGEESWDEKPGQRLPSIHLRNPRSHFKRFPLKRTWDLTLSLLSNKQTNKQTLKHTKTVARMVTSYIPHPGAPVNISPHLLSHSRSTCTDRTCAVISR